MPKYDLIVVGSGLAGVHAACVPVEKGLRVLMLDVGIEGAGQLEEGIARTFEEVRQTDAAQYKIFLGDDFSGIGAYEAVKGHGSSIASGRRAFVMQNSETYGRVETSDAEVNQSFARGGLSEVWSGVSDIFDDEELRVAGMPAGTMKKHYERIVGRIGVSGEVSGFQLQPPPRIDDNARELLHRYGDQEKHFKHLGFRLTQPLYAMLTEDTNNRKAQSYRDMDFWDNIGRTVYRARYTLEELEQKANFSYNSNFLVERVRDSADGVTLVARNVKSGERHEFTAKAVIIAAGAINTTRLLLRSFVRYEREVPIILKNYHLIPCLFPARLGKKSDPKRHSFSQLAIHGLHKVHGMSDLYAQLLSYNSLLLYRLLRYIPLPAPEALSILSFLAPALTLVDVRFPSIVDTTHSAALFTSSEGDYLRITYPESIEVMRMQKQKVRVLKKALRRLGLIPLTTIRYPYGSPSHYAGGVPYAPTASEKLSVNERGQVRGHARIFVGDSASWTALPAKPSGLSIMANANRVGNEAADFLV